ncbi:hypothetical protein GCM10011354_26410 [Egicoccus halophilus]|uniref:Uncharacterized protein n=1 Tax=Egicoccus halophilus TaxID=1670830 RepID=A0A8J3ESQ2_9ACTN|nr:hypothetical protein GCM10011354_26410 [Egicoccus halophilus]
MRVDAQGTEDSVDDGASRSAVHRLANVPVLPRFVPGHKADPLLPVRNEGHRVGVHPVPEHSGFDIDCECTNANWQTVRLGGP